jgi:hypothetical protein
MKNQGFRTLLKIWIALASAIAFLFGWVTFAHSGKPVSASSGSNVAGQTAQIAPLPTLQPIAPLGSIQQPQQQTFQQIQPQQTFNFLPQLQTRGS